MCLTRVHVDNVTWCCDHSLSTLHLLACVGVLQGLEVEVQRLINRHKADLEAAHAKADEQVKLALEGAKAKHEEQMQALRDRLRQVRTALTRFHCSRREHTTAAHARACT